MTTKSGFNSTQGQLIFIPHDIKTASALSIFYPLSIGYPVLKRLKSEADTDMRRSWELAELYLYFLLIFMMWRLIKYRKNFISEVTVIVMKLTFVVY
jgi:hypothetical protein